MLRLSPQYLLLLIPAVLVAVTVHEYAHAWVADRMGDPTPRRRGRLTLNPIVHLDPIGSLLFLIAGFGWARPVEVNPGYFSDWRRGMLAVAAAGPLSNLTAAFVIGLGFKLGLLEAGGWLGGLAYFVVRINVVLAVFNLLPVPPLDGSKILAGVLPPSQAAAYERIAPYGPLLLLALLLLPGNLIGTILWAPVNWLAIRATGIGM